MADHYYETSSGYFRDSWNYIDFVVVVFGTLAAIPSLPNISAIRVIRVLRPLRAVKRVPSLRVLVSVLLQSVVAVARVAVILSLLFIVFGIAGVNLFQGGAHSERAKALEKYNTRLSIQKATLGEDWDEVKEDAIRNVRAMLENYKTVDYTCQWQANKPSLFRVILEISRNCKRKSFRSCPQLIRLNTSEASHANFDNMYQAILSLFQVATLSGWNIVMYNSIDSVGVNQQPRRNNQPAWGLFYIFFIFLCAFFGVNLFIAIVRRKCQKLVGQPSNPEQTFDIFIMCCIGLNAGVLATQHFEEPRALTSFVFSMNLIFNLIFVFEAAVKLYAWTPQIYFRGGWNRFDFVIVIVSFISYGIDGVGGISAIRLFRLARLFRLFNKLPALKKLFNALVLSSSSLFNIGALIFIVFYIYAIFGVALFGKVAWSDPGLSQQANFVTFPAAMITLWRLATGDAWEDIQTGLQLDESSGQCSNEDGNCG
eukprot:jgi/Bigna1/51621/estExt_Genewise1Plus.C_20062